MFKRKENNPYITRWFAILIQVGFIFTFLTLFFFLYVNKVEKNAFKLQINTIVDDLYSDVKIQNIYPSDISKDAIIIIVNGALDLAKYKTKKNSMSINKKIKKNNSNIMKKSLFALAVFLCSVIICIIIAAIMGYYLPLMSHLKEAMIAVLAVAITEFIFLQVITTRYISADPNDVRKHLGEAIKNYVKNRDLSNFKYI